MFEPLLFHLRAQGLNVGLQEWLAFQRALTLGLASTVEEFFYLGRSVLVHSEAHYAAYGKAFEGALAGAELTPELRAALAEYLQDPKAWEEGRTEGLHDYGSLEDLMKAFQETLNQQNERHEGGNRWVGTGGTSPYGAGGRANQGFALGRTPGSRRACRRAAPRRRGLRVVGGTRSRSRAADMGFSSAAEWPRLKRFPTPWQNVGSVQLVRS